MDYTTLGWQESIVLGCARKEGILEAVSVRPRTAGEVSREYGLDERSTSTILLALVELGILSQQEGRFRIREEHREALLDRSHPGYAGGSIMHRFELVRGWSKMPEVLKSGLPARDEFSPVHLELEGFVFAMRRGAQAGAPAVADALLSRLPEKPRILDIGGGPGTYAEAFTNGGARVTVFDMPEVLDLMKEYLDVAGIAAVGGDFNKWVPEGPFDAAYLGSVSHIYGPKENQALFKRVHASLAPGGMIAIRDYIRGISKGAALFAVNMLINTESGGTYTEQEYRSWLVGAGFEELEILPVTGREAHLMVARRRG